MKIKIVPIIKGTSYEDEEKLINQVISKLEAENCWISQITPRQNSCIIAYDKNAILESSVEKEAAYKDENKNDIDYTHTNENNYYYETNLISENFTSLNCTYIVE